MCKYSIYLVIIALLWPLSAGAAPGRAHLGPKAATNDRLPTRLRPAYGVALREVRKYARFILSKVWGRKLARLRAAGPDIQRAEVLVDEAVHLLLPHTTKMLQDVVFGTGATYLKITLPDRARLARSAPAEGAAAKNPAETFRQAIAAVGGAEERELNDRLEQALTEDLEDYAQREVERDLGLPVRGRPRNSIRSLPPKWEEPYAREIRREVHRQSYWTLRKKRRLELMNLAATRSHAELDRARHEGPMWGLTSGISQDAWAQNRLRIDFKWGRYNWEIDRRRIRRRMDQDLAEGTWALSRLVKELTAPEAMKRFEQKLEERLRQELEKPENRGDAERYPETAKKLEERMQKALRDLHPDFDRAMDRVPLPPDVAPLARQHGRRFMREELRGNVSSGLQRQAPPLAAARRVRDKMDAWVGEALTRLDLGPSGKPGARRQAADFVKKEVRPHIDREIEETLRDAGRGDALWDQATRDRRVREIRDRFSLDRDVERAVDRQLSGEVRR